MLGSNISNLEIKYTDKHLIDEWNSIVKHEPKYTDVYRGANDIVKHFQCKEFYKRELELWNKNEIHKGLPLRSWLYYNRLKYIGKGFYDLTPDEVLRGFTISGLVKSYSFHSPYWIKKFIEDYNVKSILDPCGGWGHRLLGCLSKGIPYHYNDIDTNTYINILDMYEFLRKNNLVPKDLFTITNKDGSTDLGFDMDFVFTCPPYYNREIYSDKGIENKSYKEFLYWWKQLVINNVVNKKNCRGIAYIINNKYKEDMNNIIKELDLILDNEFILGNSKIISHFNKNKNIKEFETLFVWIKR